LRKKSILAIEGVAGEGKSWKGGFFLPVLDFLTETFASGPVSLGKIHV
jgi:hypothetical protein